MITKDLHAHRVRNLRQEKSLRDHGVLGCRWPVGSSAAAANSPARTPRPRRPPGSSSGSWVGARLRARRPPGNSSGSWVGARPRPRRPPGNSSGSWVGARPRPQRPPGNSSGSWVGAWLGRAAELRSRAERAGRAGGLGPSRASGPRGRAGRAAELAAGRAVRRGRQRYGARGQRPRWKDVRRPDVAVGLFASQVVRGYPGLRGAW
jgi:hypothetical protein